METWINSASPVHVSARCSGQVTFRSLIWNILCFLLLGLKQQDAHGAVSKCLRASEERGCEGATNRRSSRSITSQPGGRVFFLQHRHHEASPRQREVWLRFVLWYNNSVSPPVSLSLSVSVSFPLSFPLSVSVSGRLGEGRRPGGGWRHKQKQQSETYSLFSCFKRYLCENLNQQKQPSNICLIQTSKTLFITLEYD